MIIPRTIKIRSFENKLTLTITVIETKEYKIRRAVALWLIELASKILKVKTEIVKKDQMPPHMNCRCTDFGQATLGAYCQKCGRSITVQHGEEYLCEDCKNKCHKFEENDDYIDPSEIEDPSLMMKDSRIMIVKRSKRKKKISIKVRRKMPVKPKKISRVDRQTHKKKLLQNLNQGKTQMKLTAVNLSRPRKMTDEEIYKLGMMEERFKILRWLLNKKRKYDTGDVIHSVVKTLIEGEK